MNPQEIWKATLGELEVGISRANFTTWFKGTSIIDTSDSKIIIGVPNGFTKKWLNDKYHIEIVRILKKFFPDLLEVDYKISTNHSSASNITSPSPSAPAINPFAPTSPKTEKPDNTPAFNPKYTFDSFVIGNNNRLAHATSQAVCEKPGEVYNPLFIYGGVGLGKTHLIHAIGNEIHHRFPNKKVIYVSCEKFTNEFVQSITTNKTNEFKNRYRNVDVFLVDDIQFLSHKEGTQEEFFHTFNALHQTNRQIVITSDRVPKAIPDLEDRLSSRFGWGMVADVRPPNMETRIAILQSKCNEQNYSLSEDIIEHIAQKITSNIRELEGALLRIITHCSLYQATPSLDVVDDLLQDVISSNQLKNISTDQLVKSVTRYFNITFDELLSPKRNKELVYPRQITMYLLRHEKNMSFPVIGRELGGKDHTTVMHGCNKIAKELATNQSLQQDLNSIKEVLYKK